MKLLDPRQIEAIMDGAADEVDRPVGRLDDGGVALRLAVRGEPARQQVAVVAPRDGRFAAALPVSEIAVRTYRQQIVDEQSERG